MVDFNRPKFQLGQVVATPGALGALEKTGQTPEEFLKRHISGDWGDVGEEDSALNDQSLIDGSRLLSSYQTSDGTKLWVITEADRSSTCLMLPSEY